MIHSRSQSTDLNKPYALGPGPQGGPSAAGQRPLGMGPPGAPSLSGHMSGMATTNGSPAWQGGGYPERPVGLPPTPSGGVPRQLKTAQMRAGLAPPKVLATAPKTKGRGETAMGPPTAEARPATRGRATRRAATQRQSEKANPQAGPPGTQPVQGVGMQGQSPRGVNKEANGPVPTASQQLQGVNLRNPPNNAPAHPSSMGWAEGVASATHPNAPQQHMVRQGSVPVHFEVPRMASESWRPGSLIPTGAGISQTMYSSGPQQAPGYTLVPQPQGSAAYGSRETVSVPLQQQPDGQPDDSATLSQPQAGVLMHPYVELSQSGGAPLYPTSMAGSQYGGHVVQYQGVPGQLSHVPASHVMGQGPIIWQSSQPGAPPSFDHQHGPSAVGRNRHGVYYTVHVPAGSVPPHGVAMASVPHGVPVSSPQEPGGASGGQTGPGALGGAHMARQPSLQYMKPSNAEGSVAPSTPSGGMVPTSMSYMTQNNGGAVPQHGPALNSNGLLNGMAMTPGAPAISSAQDGCKPLHEGPYAPGMPQGGAAPAHAHPQPGMVMGGHFMSCVPQYHGMAQQPQGASAHGDGEGPMGVPQQILVMQPQQRGPDGAHAQVFASLEWTPQEQRIQQQREQLQQKAAMRQQQAKASMPYNVYVQPSGQMVPQGSQMHPQGPGQAGVQGQLQQVPVGNGMVPVGNHMAVYSQQVVGQPHQHAQHPGQQLVPQVMQTHQGMPQVQYGRQGMVPMGTPQVVHYMPGPYMQVPQQQYVQQQQVYHSGMPKQAAGTPKTPQAQTHSEDAAARMPVGKTSIGGLGGGARQGQGQRSKSTRPEPSMISPRVGHRVHLSVGGDPPSWPPSSESPRDPSGATLSMVVSPRAAGSRSASSDGTQAQIQQTPAVSWQAEPPRHSGRLLVPQSPAASSHASAGAHQLHQACFQQQQQQVPKSVDPK